MYKALKSFPEQFSYLHSQPSKKDNLCFRWQNSINGKFESKINRKVGKCFGCKSLYFIHIYVIWFNFDIFHIWNSLIHSLTKQQFKKPFQGLLSSNSKEFRKIEFCCFLASSENTNFRFALGRIVPNFIVHFAERDKEQFWTTISALEGWQVQYLHQRKRKQTTLPATITLSKLYIKKFSIQVLSINNL